MSIPQVPVTDVHDHALMLDVREQDEWDAGHAPGAVHIPLGELPSRLDELPDTDAGVLAVVCRGGGRSSRAVAWLLAAGIRRRQPARRHEGVGGRGQAARRRLGLCHGQVGPRVMAWFGRRRDDDDAAPEPQVEERTLPDAGDSLDPERLAPPARRPAGRR